MRLNNWLYRGSLVLGIIPLVVGIGIYLLWLLTKWPMLVAAGVYTLFGGVASVLLGFICLAVYALRTRASKGPLTTRRSILASAALLAANLPAALLVSFLALRSLTTLTVSLQNDSASAITSFELIAPGLTHQWTSVQTGESRFIRLSFEEEGSLSFKALVEDEEVEGSIQYYIYPMASGHADILYENDIFYIDFTDR